MTQEEIIKGNKLIARFMGAIETDYDEFGIGWLYPIKELYMPRQAPNIDELKYHSSWDWLMPVLIKIVSMDEYYESEIGEEPYMEGNPLAIFSTKHGWDEIFSLEDIWKHCVDFIKWYNINKK